MKKESNVLLENFIAEVGGIHYGNGNHTRQMTRSSSILPCGILNLKTGDIPNMFNVFEAWAGGSFELYSQNKDYYFGGDEGKNDDKWMIVATSGASSMNKEYATKSFKHDQTFREMGVWTFRGAFENTPEGLMKVVSKSGKRRIKCATYK